MGQPRFLVTPDWRWDDPDTPAGVRWRLLSANNRQLGRSVEVHDDVESACHAVRALKRDLARCEPVLVRLSRPGRWAWSLRLAGAPVAVSGRSYEMERAVARALAMFLAAAAEAPAPAPVVLPRPRTAGSGSTPDVVVG